MTTSNPLLPMVQPDRFEKMGVKMFAGVDRSYTFPNLMGIPAQWMEFAAFFGKIPHQTDKRAYGVSHNMRPDGIDYMCAVEVSSVDGVPSALKTIKIEPQNYAVFRHMAHVSALPATHNAIWTQWLPQSGKQAAHAANLEIYHEDFNPMTGMGGIEIWVPIKD